jgi:beta-glucanase (GH16 family)
VNLAAGRRRQTAGRGAAAVAVALCLAAAPQQASSGAEADSCGGTAPPLQAAPDGRRLELMFDQDFSLPAPSPPNSVWRTTFGDGSRTIASNAELEVYVDPAFAGPGRDPFDLRSGALDITATPLTAAERARTPGARFASGLISSQPSFSQLYGYFEIRAKLPAGKGLWPALWMLPADLTWPPEIDIMESLGDPRTVYASVHTKDDDGFTQETRLDDEGFHTFAVSWDAANLVWYVDGREVARRPTPADMHKPMYLLANLAVGGQWPGVPDASTHFPATFSIRYVRAYKFK